MSIRNAGEIANDAVKKAIKAERRRVRALVKKEKAQFKSDVLYSLGYRRACDDILAALKEGR